MTGFFIKFSVGEGADLGAGTGTGAAATSTPMLSANFTKIGLETR